VKGVDFVEVAFRHATTEERRWRHDARSPRPTLLVLAINSRHVFTRLLNFWYYSVALEPALPTILLAYQMVDSNSLFFWFCAPLDYSLSLSLVLSARLRVFDGKLSLSLSLSLWKKMKETNKNYHWKFLQSLSFGFEIFWIEILVPCRFVGGSGLIAFTFELTCARLCCWYKHLRKTGQTSSFLSFLDPWQLPSFSYTRWSGLTASQCLLCVHFFFYQHLGP
jgi:hypothetical protein